MTWRYLLQNKSDYGATLQTFYNYVTNHFNSSIKTIRTDNAPEFSDQFCTKFMKERGIVHQTTCSHRPQQNARVERKHRHVLEVARALKLQSGLPTSYWGDCVLASTYIINRIPSIVLNNVSPYEMMFGKAPDYNELKVFGCLAMATPPGVMTDKLKPRALPCVFVGYPPTKHGYKLLTLNSMTSMVSRDAQFHEHIFPLFDEALQSYLQPVPVNMHHKPPQVNDLFEELFAEMEGTQVSPEVHTTPPRKMLKFSRTRHKMKNLSKIKKHLHFQ